MPQRSKLYYYLSQLMADESFDKQNSEYLELPEQFEPTPVFKTDEERRTARQRHHAAILRLTPSFIQSINQILATSATSDANHFFLINDERYKGHITISEYPIRFITTSSNDDSDLHFTFYFGVKFPQQEEAEPVIFAARIFYDSQMNFKGTNFSISRESRTIRYNAPLFGQQFYASLSANPLFIKLVEQTRAFSQQAIATVNDESMQQYEMVAAVQPMTPAFARAASALSGTASTLSEQFESMDFNNDDLVAMCVDYHGKLRYAIPPDIYATSTPTERMQLLYEQFKPIFFAKNTDVSKHDAVVTFKTIFFTPDATSTAANKLINMLNDGDIEHFLSIIYSKIENLYHNLYPDEPQKVNALLVAVSNRHRPEP